MIKIGVDFYWALLGWLSWGKSHCLKILMDWGLTRNALMSGHRTSTKQPCSIIPLSWLELTLGGIP